MQNTDKTETLLFDAVREMKKLQFGIGSKIELAKAMNSLTRELSRQSLDIVNAFYSTHYDQVTQVLFEARDSSKQSPELRSAYDKLSKKLNVGRHVPTPVTRLFERCIKGVTYFQEEIDPKLRLEKRQSLNQSNPTPVYHRLFSCGDGTTIYRENNLVCLKGISKKEKSRRRPMIENCYVERLIYDALYVHETLHFPAKGTNAHSQNKTHLYRLDLTRDDFKTCFPGYTIDVDIEYNDGLPMTLTINRFHNEIPYSTEVYRRSYSFDRHGFKEYDPFVQCTKTVYDKEGKQNTYRKIQDFTKKARWTTFKP